MKKIILFIFVFSALTAFSQRGRSSYYKLDVGGGLGLSNYLGEMGGKEKIGRDFIMDMKLSQTRWALGGFARYKMSPYWSLRADLTYGRIQGADRLSTNRGRKGRNLSFINDMLELTARAEIILYNDNDVGGRGSYRLDFKSYIFAGVGVLIHGPKTLYNGEYVKLRPLQTEGVKYGLATATMPIGTGFYFTYKRKYRFGWELGWRMTFTDYLDDVSTFYADPSTLANPTAIALANRRPELGNDPSVPIEAHYTPGNRRGDPKDNDNYFYMLFTYSYVFRGKNSFYTQHYSWLGGRKSKYTKARIKF
jgi:hypothetical protein